MAPKNNPLEEIAKAVTRIDTTLEFQAQQLAEHIRRTELLEGQVTPLIALKDRVIGGLLVVSSGAAIGAIIHLLN